MVLMMYLLPIMFLFVVVVDNDLVQFVVEVTFVVVVVFDDVTAILNVVVVVADILGVGGDVKSKELTF